jgi:sugar/nucleoside kinase (ribokinase family)
MGRVHVVGYLSIDRIVLDGRSVEDVPGGGALYAALAARGAGARVSLHACAGTDFPTAWMDRLAALGLDLSGVVPVAVPTRRARLAYRGSERRDSVHFAEAAWWESTNALAPRLAAMPAGGDVIAVPPVPARVLAAICAQARLTGARVVADTSAAFARHDGDALLAALAGLAAFAPSLEETRILEPGRDDDGAASALAARGCPVLQKRGAAGAVLARDGVAPLLRLAAPVATSIVDTTGAGDSVLGALAAGLSAHKDLTDAARDALAWGAGCVGGLGPSALGLAVEPAGAT